MANHLGRVGAMAKGRAPFDAKAAADNAAIVVTMSKLPFAAFVEGSDKGAPTRAKPEIWKESDKVKDWPAQDAGRGRQVRCRRQDRQPRQDQDRSGLAWRSCKACHDDYRAEKQLQLTIPR